ncbi:MAG TPA: glycosyltransferase family 2 protein [Thermoleophilaceae bacterium]|jgi:glycosyltransferase involved in cell wall biosynthesis
MTDTGAIPLSVVIPAYNRETMIARAVASAWGQHPRPPAEVIVVDDCSTDRSGAVAAELGARVIRHEQNRGLGASRNTGIRAATQPWIALLDSDDEWLPHLLDALWRLRDDHILVGLASLNCGDDPAYDRFAGPTGRRPVVLESPARLLYPENYIAASGTMVRADAVAAVGGYREDLSHGEDLDLWLRVLEHGSGIVAPMVGVIYHLHAGQVTRDQVTMAARQLDVLRSYSDRSWWSSARVEAWRAGSAWDELRRGDGRTVARCAAFIARHPSRIAGLGGLLLRRWRLRRRSASVTRAGTPTVAVLAGRRVPLAGLVSLVRRPPGVAVVDSPAQRALVRALGIRPARQSELPDLVRRPWSPDGTLS